MEKISMLSLEQLIQSATRALVIGVGGGGDVVGALAAARFLEFHGVEFVLGGLSWECPLVDPLPGPRTANEVRHVRLLHEYAWLVNPKSQTETGASFTESRVSEAIGRDVLMIDLNGGVRGVVEALTVALAELQVDLLVGVDVGGDSLAKGDEKGLYSPLADSVMLAAFTELEQRGRNALWAVFGYGSDGEMTADEIERNLSSIAKHEGLFGAWGLTKNVLSELEKIVQNVATEASALPLQCARGAWGTATIRGGLRKVKLTPLATLTFFLSPTVLYRTLSRPAQAVRQSSSLDEANEALNSIGLETELDLERKEFETSNRRSMPPL
jgi:hypothetical protein